MDKPTFTFKVNINCCTQCPRKAKEKLQKLQGVESITVDATKGLVTISGRVDPEMIVDKFKKWGRKAELLLSDKQLELPKTPVHDHLKSWTPNTPCRDTRNKSNVRKQAGDCCTNMDHDSDVDNDRQLLTNRDNMISVVPRGKIKKRGICWLGKKLISGLRMGSSNSNDKKMTSQGLWKLPRVPLHGFGGGQQYARPLMLGRPPFLMYGPRLPPPPLPWASSPYRPVGSLPPQLYNPMVHYTCYEDNHRYC